MNQEQFNGLARNVLAILGGWAIGHGLANDAVWQSFVGFVLTAGAAVFSWRSHDLTLDAIMGVIRAAVSALGGYAVFRGWASPDMVAQFGALALAIAPLGWSLSAHRDISLPPDNSPVAKADSPPLIGLAVLALVAASSPSGCSIQQYTDAANATANVLKQIGTDVVAIDCRLADLIQVIAKDAGAAARVQATLDKNAQIARDACPLLTGSPAVVVTVSGA